jgi:hypothetical protein
LLQLQNHTEKANELKLQVLQYIGLKQQKAYGIHDTDVDITEYEELIILLNKVLQNYQKQKIKLLS